MEAAYVNGGKKTDTGKEIHACYKVDENLHKKWKGLINNTVLEALWTSGKATLKLTAACDDNELQFETYYLGTCIVNDWDNYPIWQSLLNWVQESQDHFHAPPRSCSPPRRPPN